MPAIAHIAGVLIAAPKPVICLDTCDIPEVVQCLDWEKANKPRAVSCIEPVRRLLNDLALARVMGKHRPSQDGNIKDSINFEHYLELARRLRAGGFAEEVIFVSKNRKDYWNAENPHIHPDLHPQINDPAVQLRFFGSIVATLGFLGI